MALAEFNTMPFGAVGISGANPPRWFLGTSAPTTGTFYVGDFVFNNSPASSSASGTPFIYGWQCTTASTASTAASFTPVYAGISEGPAATVTATSGTLAANTRLLLLNAAAGPTLSLPNALSFAPASFVTIINIANNSATLTPLAANQYQGGSVAAITLAQYAISNIVTDGTSNWYKAS
jgi:hypothetical protein